MDKVIIDMNIFETDDRKRRYYNQIVYLIYDVTSDRIIFKDNNKYNLTRENCIVI